MTEDHWSTDIYFWDEYLDPGPDPICFTLNDMLDAFGYSFKALGDVLKSSNYNLILTRPGSSIGSTNYPQFDRPNKPLEKGT